MPGVETEVLNPVFIAEIASRLFNELPGAGSVPRYETDAAEAPSSLASSISNKTHPGGEPFGWESSKELPQQDFPAESRPAYVSESVPAQTEHGYNFLPVSPEPQPETLGHHAEKLTEQQNYSENESASYGLDEFIRRSLPATATNSGILPEIAPETLAAFFSTLNSGLPPEDDFSFRILLSAAQNPAAAAGSHLPDRDPQTFTPEALTGSRVHEQLPEPPERSGVPADGQCYAERLYRTFEQQQGGPDLNRVFQSLRQYAGLSSGDLTGISAPQRPAPSGSTSAVQPEIAGQVPAPAWPPGSQDAPDTSRLPFSLPPSQADPYYFLSKPHQPVHQAEGFDVMTIRRDFPVLRQLVHGKQLVWFDNAATTQKPLSVINAVAQFYANDNSNIHRGAHTLAARSTDAYEGAREKIRQFIGAGSASEIIYVRGTTEGINLVAQTWGRKFIQPGDEIVLSILEHHANIVPWQMLAQEKGARIRVVPVNDRGEIILEEYTKLLGPRTRFVSLTQASNGLGTILPVREMIRLAKRYDAKVLIDGAQSVAHIPVNVQDLDADFFVFSGHKIFAPAGIGVLYGKRELLELMPPWQGGGNMIKDVRFEETLYNEPPARFEAGTPSISDAIGLGAALDYVRKIGLENIARYEHELTVYATEKLIRISGLRIIGTARNKVGVVSFVLNNLSNDEAGKLLDREGIAVRTGHHCTQPSLRRFGVEGTIRPSLAFYNTKDEIDRLADVIDHIQRR